MARFLRRADGFFDGGGVTPSPTPSLQLYKRTYGALDILVDGDGKVVTDDTVYVEVGAADNPNACVLSLCSSNPDLNDIIAAWGKTTAVFTSQELGTPDYTITIGDDFVGIVGETATPAVTVFPTSIESITPELPPSEPYATITVKMTQPVNKSEVIANLKGVVTSEGVEREIIAFEYHGNVCMGTQVSDNSYSVAIEGTTLTITDESGGHSGYTVKAITWGV